MPHIYESCVLLRWRLCMTTFYSTSDFLNLHPTLKWNTPLSLDTTVLLLTCLSIPIIALFAYLIYVNPSTTSIIIAACAIASFLFCLVQYPTSTYVDDQIIKINMIIGSKKFIRNEYKFSKLTKDDLKGSIRLFASAGVGGYIGIFHNTRLRNFHMHAINKQQLWLLENHNGKKYVINIPSGALDEWACNGILRLTTKLPRMPGLGEDLPVLRKHHGSICIHRVEPIHFGWLSF